VKEQIAWYYKGIETTEFADWLSVLSGPVHSSRQSLFFGSSALARMNVWPKTYLNLFG